MFCYGGSIYSALFYLYIHYISDISIFLPRLFFDTIILSADLILSELQFMGNLLPNVLMLTTSMVVHCYTKLRMRLIY